MPNLPRPCLMLVTEPSPRLAEIVREAVAGGVNVVQWREKRGVGMGYNRAYAALCAAVGEGVTLTANGNWERAAKLKVRAIHLPEKSVPVGVVRHHLGPKSLVGKSVHSVLAAEQAVKQGADYLIAGTIFASQSHPDIAPAGLDFLREVCAAVSVPVIAIGGVTPENLAGCVDAGAAGVAALSPLMRADDPQAVARTYWAALETAWKNRPPAPNNGGAGGTIMRVTVNGEARETAAATVGAFLESRGLHARLVVVEHNGEIVPRDKYTETVLQENDILEIVQMMAGG